MDSKNNSKQESIVNSNIMKNKIVNSIKNDLSILTKKKFSKKYIKILPAPDLRAPRPSRRATPAARRPPCRAR